MIFLNYEGIKGNATAEGYKDCLTVDSLNFGIGRACSMEPGNCSNREATRPNLSEVSISHLCDNSATSLFKEAVSGSAGKKVTVHFCQTGADKLVEYMKYELFEVLVSGYSISAMGNQDPVETISLSFTKMTCTYTDHDKSNKVKGPQTVGYDLETAKAL